MARRRDPAARAIMGLIALPFKIGFVVHKEVKKQNRIKAKEAARAQRAEIRGLKSELKNIEKGIRELRELEAMVQFKGLLDSIVDENDRLKKELGK